MRTFEELTGSLGGSEYNQIGNKMKALFWDYDGTLVDTRQKNYQVTRNIIKEVTGSDPATFSLLRSFENYKKGIVTIKNWRDIYQNHFGFSPDQTDRVGNLWAEFQMKDQTSANLFEGITEVVRTYQDLPQVIISQNASDGIRGVLEDNDLTDCFNMIIGYEEVDIRKQKPEPDGFLICLEKLSLTNDFTIYYVGDHEADVLFVQKTKKVLESMQVSTRLVSIGAFYGNDQNISQWTLKPDYSVKNPFHIVEIVNST